MPIPNFGLTQYLPLVVYLGLIVLCITNIFRPKVGLYGLVCILPFENLRQRLYEFPEGHNIADFLFLSLLLGCLLHAKPAKEKGGGIIPFSKYPIATLCYTFLSLFWASVHFGLEFPLKLDNPHFLNWKNYVMMPVLYLFTVTLISSKREARLLTLLMVACLFVTDYYYFLNFRHRDLSIFRWDVKTGLIFPRLGGNEFAAFLAYLVFLPASLFFYEKKKLFKYFFAFAVAFTIYPIFFLFSRGAYVAVFLGTCFLAVMRRNTALIAFLIVLVISWQTMLPSGVVQRIEMTQSSAGTRGFDDSAGGRIDLWITCLVAFAKFPPLGAGFDTYKYFGVGNDDPHNYFMEVLGEQGIVGFGIFILMLFFVFKKGISLFKNSTDDYLKGLGLATACATVSLGLTNLFGDRWSYTELGGYFWVLMALIMKSDHFTDIERPEACLETTTETQQSYQL